MSLLRVLQRRSIAGLGHMFSFQYRTVSQSAELFSFKSRRKLKAPADYQVQSEHPESAQSLVAKALKERKIANLKEVRSSWEQKEDLSQLQDEASALERKVTYLQEQSENATKARANKSSDRSHFKNHPHDTTSKQVEVDPYLEKQIVKAELTELSKEIHTLATEPDYEYVETIQGPVPRPRRRKPGHVRRKPAIGKADPSVPMSDVPCPGCGAKLHCVDDAIPGFVTANRFVSLTEQERTDTFCQRCILMRHHNVALDAKVSPEDYAAVVRELRNRKCVIVLVVDVTDLPNSVYEGIGELVGVDHPFFVVGNKVDLIVRDGAGYLDRIRKCLEHAVRARGVESKSVRSVSLVSAKTGYGVEDLVTGLFAQHKRFTGDVYLVGSTNAGKSSLFNALLASDYCKHVARDFIHRATVSNWPGTTLSTLRFPVLKPTDWRLAKRQRRLDQDTARQREEDKVRQHNLKTSKHNETLQGHVGQTLYTSHERVAPKFLKDPEMDAFRMGSFRYNDETQQVMEGSFTKEQLLNESRHNLLEERFIKDSRWCIDTPGVINPEQIMNVLSAEELGVLLPRGPLTPRTVLLKPGQGLLVSGLARLDYCAVVQPETPLLWTRQSMYVTVFSPSNVPLVVRDAPDLDEFYVEHAGTERLGVPLGGKERLRSVPSLIGREFKVTGKPMGPQLSKSKKKDGPTYREVSAADVTLSSLGWVSLTPQHGVTAIVRAYTPGGVGLKFRDPPLLSRAVTLRGARKGHSPYYHSYS